MIKDHKGPARAAELSTEAQIEALVRRLAETEAALQALLEDQVDAIVDPVTATPLLLRQTQQALRESVRRFETSIENMLDCFGIYSAVRDESGRITDFEIVYVNAAACKSNRMTRDEMVGQALCELLPAHRETGLFDDYCQVVETGQPLVKETLVYEDVFDEQRLSRAYDIRAAKMGDGFVASWRDVIERVETEQALRESRSLLETLFESTPEGILLVDPQGRILRANRQIEEMFGYRRQELHGQPLEILVPDAKQARHVQHRADYRARPRARSMAEERELYGRRQDGALFPADVMLGPVEIGQKPHVLAVVRDRTRRQEIERELRQSEERFRSAFEHAPFGMAIVRPDGRLLQVNRALGEMLGYEAQELVHKTSQALTHPDDAPVEAGLYDDLLAGERDYGWLEKRYVHRDGHPVWTHSSVAVVRDPQGTPRNFVLQIRDVSQQKALESELHEVRRRLADGQEQERISLAQELHDGPIQDLYGARFQLNNLAQALQGKEGLAQLEIAQAILERTNHTLRELCYELRPPTLISLGLDTAIRSHAREFEEQNPGLEVRLELAHDQDALTESARLALFRIYQQALSNVARHANAHDVRVRLRLEPQQASLEVQDDGRGFETPQRWIELIRRGRLGLAGAAERAELVGGRLEIESVPGDGTRLKATIPRNQKERIK